MIFRSDEIPSNFNKIAEISDNFIVWVSENNLLNDTEYEAYIQFFKPCFSYIYIEDYKIKNGTEYNYIPNYGNNGVYSYVDNYDVEFNLNTYEVSTDEFSNNLNYSGDCVPIFFGQLLCVVCILWIFKQFSRLWFKGGLY